MFKIPVMYGGGEGRGAPGVNEEGHVAELDGLRSGRQGQYLGTQSTLPSGVQEGLLDGRRLLLQAPVTGWDDCDLPSPSSRPSQSR